MSYEIPQGWRTGNPGIVEMQSQVDVKDLWSVLKESDNKRNSTVALVQTIDSKGKDVWITKIPKVTAGSLF